MGDLSTVVGGYTTVLAKDSLEREGQGKGKREKGKGKREKGKGKREKGKGKREKGKGKRKQGKGSREKEAGKRKQGKGSRESGEIRSLIDLGLERTRCGSSVVSSPGTQDGWFIEGFFPKWFSPLLFSQESLYPRYSQLVQRSTSPTAS